MARPPVLRGELPSGGAIELLREIEGRSITGRLVFESDSSRGEITFFGGEIAIDQRPSEDGSDPVDAFLGLTGGRYEVFQELPPLAVSKGDEYEKRGSLAVHVPADLMRYCEQAGLTGVLELSHEDRRAEATYDAGELISIELDGEDADLSVVFGWEKGRFRIRLDPTAAERAREEIAPPPEPEPLAAPSGRPRKGEDTRQFLRVVEMALADVTLESEKARSPTRTSPPLPPPPKARPRPESIPPPPEKERPPTVRLIYLGGEAPSLEPDLRTRHVRRDVSSEIGLPEARPERRARGSREESDDMAKKRKRKNDGPASKRAPAEPAPEADAPEPEASSEEEAPIAAAEGREPSGPIATEAASSPASAVAAKTAAEAPKKDAPTPPAAPPVAPASLAGTFGWALAVLGVGLVILAFLAMLPPVSCRPGRESCGFGTGCVDTSSNPAHCGGCDLACTASSICRDGECVQPEPPPAPLE